MSSPQRARSIRHPRRASAWLLPLTAALCGTVAQSLSAATNLVLWDTGTPVNAATALEPRAGWVQVPTELFAFEADPAKAASDPGYYGREYAFQGDAVVENRRLVALFRSADARVELYAKTRPSAPGDSSPTKAPADRLAKVLEFRPAGMDARPATIRRCAIVRNAADEVVLDVTFEARGSAEGSARFAFGRDEIVEIEPRAGMPAFRLLSPIACGVAPAFIGDDLILDPAQIGSDTLTIPADHLFLGLMRGENHELVLTWPAGAQRLRLHRAGTAATDAAFESIEFDHTGQPLYVAVLSAPGIWHREMLKPVYLEQDVELSWQPPFPAKWQTQLSEEGVPTTFAFRPAKQTIWRAVAGSYTYPVWLKNGRAFCHFSKKVPPRGQAIIYALEPQATPSDIRTAVDVLKATLGRPACGPILDVAGRKLRTHHRRGGEGVHRACTCGCTEAIQAVFAAGQETAKAGYIKEALADMNFFVERHLERIGEYQRFAAEVTRLLDAQAKAQAGLKPYCAEWRQIVRQIPDACEVQQDNMKSLEHAAELTRRTLALSTRRSPDNLQAYNKLLDAWRAMGGAQDSVLGQCHVVARQLFQAAGYSAVTNPQALALAQSVRARCRQVLRNPDGYEIWADY